MRGIALTVVDVDDDDEDDDIVRKKSVSEERPRCSTRSSALNPPAEVAVEV